MAQKGECVFLQMEVGLSYADGSTEERIVHETSHNGYRCTMTTFALDAALADVLPQVEMLAESIRFELAAGTMTIGLPGLSVQLTQPVGMTIHPTAEAADVTLPEAPSGEVVGCAEGEEWFLLWTLDESTSGDFDRLSDSGIRAQYVARAKKKKSAGCTVTLSADHQESRQRYIVTGYHFADESGCPWHAEEYYTRQAGWGMSVTVYSCGMPLSEDVRALLETVVNSQLVSAEGE